MAIPLLIVALVLLCSFTEATPPRTCESVEVPPCPNNVPRDLLFVMDASDSLDPWLFQTNEMDFVQSLYCAFDPSLNNRGGLITFAHDIEVRIPLGSYTPERWFELVDQQRALGLCCSCCTPTATAFQLALQTFQASPPDFDTYPIIFTITDGAPWQNTFGPFAWPGIPAATYIWNTVPQTALELKMWNDKARIMMVGIPNKFGDTPRIGYFSGIPDPASRPKNKDASWQCIERGNKKSCAQMKTPPFPIVSEPILKNIFSSDNIVVQDLIDLTVKALCEIIPTNNPTPKTNSPTTSLPSKTPTKSPTNAPTKKPTPGPSSPPTKLPTQPPSFRPSSTPTVSSPSATPTKSPFKPELDGLDMYFLLDRSRSMRWVPDLCRAAPGGELADSDSIACWHLFLKFVSNIVERTAEIPFHDSIVGWFDDFGPSNVKRGIRVWLYAFACNGHQEIPVSISIGEKISNRAEFDAALARALLLIPDGGTCPGAVMERAVAAVQGSDVLNRIYKTALLFTDGVFYDQPRPRQAELGFFHFNVLTYAMGISIPSEGEDYGLSPQEIQRQRRDLLSFVEDDDTRLFNFGINGLQLLDEIAQELVDQLPRDAVNHLPDVINTPYFCGWTNELRCTEMDPEKTATGEFCKWNSVLRKCYTKDFCRFRAEICQKDAYCRWNGNRCVPK